MIKESTNKKWRRRKDYGYVPGSLKVLVFKILSSLHISQLSDIILVCFLILNKYVCIYNFLSSISKL